MYKDFKKSETLDTGFTSGSSLLWMFSGIVLGLLVGLGMYFFSNDKMPSVSMLDTLEKKIQQAQTTNPATKNLNNVSQQKINYSANSKTASNEDSAPRKNKFSYYAVLPNLDVPIGSAKPINTAAAAASVAASNIDESTENQITEQFIAEIEEQNNEPAEVVEIGDYLLQVASFKKQSMADKTRGRLSNKGIDARVQKKKIKGRYWYRVVAGPVDQVSVDDWKHTAEKLGHKPLVISVR